VSGHGEPRSVLGRLLAWFSGLQGLRAVRPALPAERSAKPFPALQFLRRFHRRYVSSFQPPCHDSTSARMGSGSVGQASMIEAKAGSIATSAPLSAPLSPQRRFSRGFSLGFESLRAYSPDLPCNGSTQGFTPGLSLSSSSVRVLRQSSQGVTTRPSLPVTPACTKAATVWAPSTGHPPSPGRQSWGSSAKPADRGGRQPSRRRAISGGLR